MVGACEGEKFLYVNENMTNAIRGVSCNIDPNQFIELAKKRYEKDSENIDKLETNETIRRVVNETLNEMLLF